MWNNLLKPLLALSLGLNLAFVAMWLTHSIPDWVAVPNIEKTVIDPVAVPSSLHREIGVTPEQWARIQPIIDDFREKAGKQRQMITSLRGQLIDLLTLPEVDKAAIRAKQEEILAGQRQMQNVVIDHLLKEKEILSAEQAKKLIQSLCEQCRHEGGMGSGKDLGLGRVLTEHLLVGTMDKEKME
jgi:hypothetical protein